MYRVGGVNVYVMYYTKLFGVVPLVLNAQLLMVKLEVHIRCVCMCVCV